MEPAPAHIRLAVVVSFRDEEQFLPVLLRSLETQRQPADEVLLVDDGSVDRSGQLARAFAAQHANVRYLGRPRRASARRERDRLADAPEMQAFTWGVEQLTAGWQVAAKMDGDLQLPASLFEDIRSAFAADPALGLVGSYLSILTSDGPRREHTPDFHVRGPNKFYRRGCYKAIAPIPALPGWEAIDELRARLHGWRTHSIAVRDGDIIHLRPTGLHDGRLRAYRRWGLCAWVYGAHPFGVLAGAARRSIQRPYLLGGVSYLVGWATAGLRHHPRADAATRAFARKEDLRRIRRGMTLSVNLLTGRPVPGAER